MRKLCLLSLPPRCLRPRPWRRPQPMRRCRGCGVGLGILGGVVVGSAIAGAYAYPRTYYPVAGYDPYPTYYAPAPYACPGGYWARRPVTDRFGNVVGYSRPRYFCPQY
jgi:hypothetical protein